MTGPQTLTIMESNALLDVFLKDTGTLKHKRKSARNYLMGLLMLDAGLRVSETVQLLITDLWLNGEPRHSLQVREGIAKYKAGRVIPLSTRIQAATKVHYVRNWVLLAEPTSGFAFYKELSNNHLTDRQAERIIGQAAEKAIGRWVHPHILRHTAASRWMRTCNARVVQDLLGHKHLSSTQIYTHPNADDKRKALALSRRKLDR
ncbi:unnamed protein product [marine sediment metagenome]|uniref:Tyr recombinase domain-containing protein n=1 Tax=marine sediment metagenome TaxID=412755 RepID=X1KFW4_9ZZZZ